jgi:hypothetical protein
MIKLKSTTISCFFGNIGYMYEEQLICRETVVIGIENLKWMVTGSYHQVKQTYTVMAN